MSTKPRKKAALQRLAEATDAETVINVALVLTGARSACVSEPTRLTQADKKKIAKAKAIGDVETVGQIYDVRSEESVRAAVEAIKAFPDVKIISNKTYFFCYRPDLVSAVDIKTIRRNDDTPKYHQAMGRALGYVGTAFPCNKYDDVVRVSINATLKGRTICNLFTFCAFPREIHSALLLFETFMDKAKTVIGVELSKGIIVTDIAMRIGRSVIRNS